MHLTLKACLPTIVLFEGKHMTASHSALLQGVPYTKEGEILRISYGKSTEVAPKTAVKGNR